MLSSNLLNEEALAHWGLSRQKTINHSASYNVRECSFFSIGCLWCEILVLATSGKVLSADSAEPNFLAFALRPSTSILVSLHMVERH
jgi:hypothetical protein